VSPLAGLGFLVEFCAVICVRTFGDEANSL